MLAHKASYDAWILAEQFAGIIRKPNYDVVPSCVYTYPEIAWVGLSEESAKQSNLEFKVGRTQFAANGKALAMGEAEGQIKTLIGKDGKFLGTAMWGPEVSNLIIEATSFQALHIVGQQVGEVIHPHPTLSEAFLDATENALGTSAHS